MGVKCKARFAIWLVNYKVVCLSRRSKREIMYYTVHSTKKIYSTLRVLPVYEYIRLRYVSISTFVNCRALERKHCVGSQPSGSAAALARLLSQLSSAKEQPARVNSLPISHMHTASRFRDGTLSHDLIESFSYALYISLYDTYCSCQISSNITCLYRGVPLINSDWWRIIFCHSLTLVSPNIQYLCHTAVVSHTAVN